MTFAHPWLLLLIPTALAFLWWSQRDSDHPMPPERRRVGLWIRGALLVFVVLSLVGIDARRSTRDEAVLFVFDHSKSVGDEGLTAARAEAQRLLDALPRTAHVGFLTFGDEAEVLAFPRPGVDTVPEIPAARIENDGHHTNLGGALEVASGLFPPHASRRIVLLTDGNETRGSLREATREASVRGITVDIVPIRGPQRADVRVLSLDSSRSVAHEGASILLTARVESTHDDTVRATLYENGVQVESHEVALTAGEVGSVEFRRTPQQRNLYRYRVVVTEVEADTIPENNQGMALVEVRGQPLVLYLEGDESDSTYLVRAMEREGIRLQARSAKALPDSLPALAVYDGVIVSDVPARHLSDRSMALLKDYVEQLGGGFLMIGGGNSFGVGGYYRTPLEEILPVKVQPPDKEEKYSVALALVLDRSGSMGGQKIELCKSAAIASAEMLSRRDFIGVVSFDSQARWLLPLTRAGSRGEIQSRVATLNAGGGTNAYPGMTLAYDALQQSRAKVKHMIVLTDGHTGGQNFNELATRIQRDGITVSTVGVGGGANAALLQGIAQAGGGSYYHTQDPNQIPKIFTQDTAVHARKMLREETFNARLVEEHPMLAGWTADGAPPLLGYVRTLPKATAQVPLVSDIGDPVLAHWRFGLGKVTAFTSDCKSKWAALWVNGWPGYSQFWGQVIRETVRNPQGHSMSLRVAEKNQDAKITLDLLEDAAQYRNAAAVLADVYYVPAGALSAAVQQTHALPLEQTGPGRYETSFRPDEPGVYLVRAQSGAEMISTGYVHEVSSESPLGRVNRPLLERVAEETGGAVVTPGTGTLEPHATPAEQSVDLTPWLLHVVLLLVAADLFLRRWTHATAVWEFVRGGRAS